MVFSGKMALRPGWLLLALAMLCLAPSAAQGCTCAAGCDVYNGSAPVATTIAQAETTDYAACACSQGDEGIIALCLPEAPKAPDTSAALQTATTSNPNTAANFISAVSTSIDTATINKVSTTNDGRQTSSLADANEVASLGANQAATIGAIFCAQGANTQLTDPGNSPALYANCQQNFGTAKVMAKNASGYTPDNAILNGDAAKQSLADFEKNFGVPPEDYLHKMLGSGGGPAALFDVVGDKIPEAKLTEALDQASKLAPGDLTGDPNKFAVNLGESGQQKTNSLALRDTLKKKMGANDGADKTPRNPASWTKPRTPAADSGMDGLAPLRDGFFATNDTTEELTIFDVVHRKYQALTPMMKPGKKLAN